MAGQECHDVTGGDNMVELCEPGISLELEGSEVTNNPLCGRVIFLSYRDEIRVKVDSNDLVAAASQIATEPARSTASVKNPRSALRECIDQACLTVNIVTGPLEVPPPLRIANRMIGILTRHGFPDIVLGRAHTLKYRPLMSGCRTAIGDR